MAFTPIFGTGFEMGAVPTTPGRFSVQSGGATDFLVDSPGHTGSYYLTGKGYIISRAYKYAFNLLPSEQRSDIATGVWIKTTSDVNTIQGLEVELSDGNTLSLKLNTTTWCYDFYINTTLMVAGTIPVVDPTQWHNIQILVSIGDSGYFQSRTEGGLDINYSGDTKPGASSTITKVKLLIFDDLTYLDDWIIGYGDWTGDIRFDAIVPDGDTELHDWIPIGTSLQDTPAAPDVAVGDGTGLTGAYYYKVTLVDPGGETLASVASSVVNPSNQDVDLSNIPVGLPDWTTDRKIYRTAAGGATYKLCATINDNTTTDYTDSLADGSLGANEPANVHWSTLDEKPPNDSDGILTATDDAQDLHTLSDWAEDAKVALFATQWHRLKKDTADTQQAKFLMRYVASLSTSDPFDMLTSWQYYFRMMLLNPDTTAWENTDFEDLEIGIERYMP